MIRIDHDDATPRSGEGLFDLHDPARLACAHLGSSQLADDYVRTDFTVGGGRPDSVVNAIVQTANGLLWEGTQWAVG